MKEQNVHVVVDYDLNNIDILNKDRLVRKEYVYINLDFFFILFTIFYILNIQFRVKKIFMIANSNQSKNWQTNNL